MSRIDRMATPWRYPIPVIHSGFLTPAYSGTETADATPRRTEAPDPDRSGMPETARSTARSWFAVLKDPFGEPDNGHS